MRKSQRSHIYLNYVLLPLHLGTVYFNHRHGCQRCNAIGKFDVTTHRVCFPEFCDNNKRTDSGFRARLDELHHKEQSILEDLIEADGSPMLDMVTKFPVSDPLHLLDEGVMKKCINIWLNGTKTNPKMKWPKATVAIFDKQILDWNRELPSDFCRKMRSLQYLAHWKATEFRHVLLYIGIVAFKDKLTEPEYLNFLRLCLAVRICSSEAYVKKEAYKDIAQTLLSGFCKHFCIIYGFNEIVSNIHNIAHVMDDVNNFGSLNSISTYPFENHLKDIKLQIHPSNSSIEQVSRRLAEISIDRKNNYIDFEVRRIEKSCWSPILKYEMERNNFKYIKITPNVFLSVKKIGDKWFLTKDDEIVQMKYATIQNQSYLICGSAIKQKFDFFQTPYSSHKSNIYSSDSTCLKENFYNVRDIKAKMVCLSYHNQNVFIPLLHSIDECLEYCSNKILNL